MSKNSSIVRKWINRRGSKLDKATLGQLMILLELAEAPSVAAIGDQRDDGGMAVNARQKLQRLQRALGIGKLTMRMGRYTRPTPAGLRVAAEIGLFFQELSNVAKMPEQSTRWTVGAGDAWLNGIVLPAITSISKDRPGWKWEVKNLRAHDVCEGLRDGSLQFGFIRKKDATAVEGLEVTGAPLETSSFRILAPADPSAPKVARDLIRWLVEQRRSLAQQGTSWPFIRDLIARELKLTREMEGLEPTIICENHSHSITAAANGAWTIVPAALNRSTPPALLNVELKAPAFLDEMVLFVYPRAIEKYAEADEARTILRRVIGKAMTDQLR